MTKLINVDDLRTALAEACDDEAISMHYAYGIFYCFSSRMALSDEPYRSLTYEQYATFAFVVGSTITFLKSRIPMDEVMDALEKHGFHCELATEEMATRYYY